MSFPLVVLAASSLVVSAAQAAPLRIVCIGDSLTEGYDLPADQAFPAELQRLLAAKGREVVVVNAGTNGATSASGPSKLRWQLKNKPDVVVLALGANDGLRGQSVEALRDNLDATITQAKQAGVKVLLAGMKIPTNYGADYARSFEAVYPTLAKKHGIPLVPFLLEGVAAKRELNLPDGIHPNADGQRIVARNVLALLESLL
jgi:acyl-CoA thioesterase I